MKRIGILDILKIPREMLLLTGMWPKRAPTKLYKLRNTVLFVGELILYSLFILELYLDLSKKNYTGFSEILSLFTSGFSYQLKRVIFMKNNVKFMDALDELRGRTFSNSPRETDVFHEKQRKWLELMARSFQLIVVSLVFLFFLRPFVTKEHTAVLFTDYDLGIWKFPLHFAMIWCLFWGCWNNTSFDILASGLISIPTSQFEVLNKKLMNVRKWAGLTYEQVDCGIVNEFEDFDEKLDENICVMLGECVEHHLAILRYCSNIQSIFNVYFLVQFGTSVIAICNTWFQLMLTEDFANKMLLVFYTVGLTIQLGIYCFYGNNLNLASEEVRDACYLSDWYLCGPRVRKSLMIIMERAKRPTLLTAGKLAGLSLISFASLMRSSYSYFALMNTLYGK